MIYSTVNYRFVVLGVLRLCWSSVVRGFVIARLLVYLVYSFRVSQGFAYLGAVFSV